MEVILVYDLKVDHITSMTDDLELNTEKLEIEKLKVTSIIIPCYR